MLERLTDLAGEITPQPVSAVVFGSFARGEADESSDLDILLVHPELADDERWGSSIEVFRTAAHRLTGNVVQVLEVPEREAGRRLRGKGSLWLDIVRDGLLLHGKSIDQLRSHRSA